MPANKSANRPHVSSDSPDRTPDQVPNQASVQGSEAAPKKSGKERDRLIAGFAALAIGIHIIEASLPSPLPGVKPGLANVITLLVLLRYGLGAAIWVAALRILVGSLLIGSFLTPTFMLSASGAVCSLAALALLYGLRQILPKRLAPSLAPGAVGLSLAAAWAHMSGQLLVAWLLFIPHSGIFSLAPVLLTAATVFGLISGMIAALILQGLPPLNTTANTAV